MAIDVILEPASGGGPTFTNWQNFGGATKGASVRLPNDDNSTYIFADNPDTVSQSFFVTNADAIPRFATINSVTGYARVMYGPGFGAQTVTIRLLTVLSGTTEPNSDIVIPVSASWADYTMAMGRPGGGSWAPLDVKDATFEMGIRTRVWTGGFVGADVRCTTLGLTVNVSLVPPTDVTTLAATGISTTTAQLNGSYTLFTGTVSDTYPNSYYFEYGPTTAYGSQTTTFVDSTTSASAKSIIGNLTGLTPNTLYHFRLVGTNADATTNGSDLTFTTDNGDKPCLVF